MISTPFASLFAAGTVAACLLAATPHAAVDPALPVPPLFSPQAGRAPGDVTPALARILEEIRDKDTGSLAVSKEDGRFLRLMVASSRAKRVLEIGGASGYSGIWIALGLRDTGGRLVTIEYDPARARALAANIARAGFSDIVQVVAGDAFKEIPKLTGSFDFVFLDAWKKDYKRFFELVYPRLDPGGLFLAHNVVNKRNEMGDFLDAIEQQPGLVSATVSPSGEGISVSWKRK